MPTVLTLKIWAHFSHGVFVDFISIFKEPTIISLNSFKLLVPVLEKMYFFCDVETDIIFQGWNLEFEILNVICSQREGTYVLRNNEQANKMSAGI